MKVYQYKNCYICNRSIRILNPIYYARNFKTISQEEMSRGLNYKVVYITDDVQKHIHEDCYKRIQSIINWCDSDE